MIATMTADSPVDFHGAGVAERLAPAVVEHFFQQTREFPHDRTGLKQLRFIGNYMKLMTAHPDFPDRGLGAAVHAKCEALDLEWKALMEPMTDAEADAVLADAGLV